eukprot:TRINITY_DN1947_c0_g2_i1.p2 TRINITY_DN1947_c0_g2~~TRINITY_DN1947_c0_g2_i1.p2  ORF type:complete len:130 (+),score=1.85 TRINITY_DN1947_c0_g2_i1:319-708(+)
MTNEKQVFSDLSLLNLYMFEDIKNSDFAKAKVIVVVNKVAIAKMTICVTSRQYSAFIKQPLQSSWIDQSYQVNFQTQQKVACDSNLTQNSFSTTKHNEDQMSHKFSYYQWNTFKIKLTAAPVTARCAIA